MATGDIGSVLDTLQFDSSEGYVITALKLSSGVVALWYRGVGNDGFLKTYPVDADGNIGDMIDSWEFEVVTYYASYYHPSVVHVSGNVYATAYRDSSDKVKIVTMTVGTDGIITKTAIDTYTGGGVTWNFGGIIKVPGTTKYIVFWGEYAGGNFYARMASFNIEDDGSSITQVDSWYFVTIISHQIEPQVIHIAGTIFAITYNNETTKNLSTVSIAANGTITKAFIDTETFGVDNLYDMPMRSVSYGVVAIFPSLTADLLTYSISSAGVITLVDTGIFAPRAGVTVSPYLFRSIRGISYFVISYQNSFHGYVSTVSITSAGVIGAVIEELKVESDNSLYAYTPIEVVNGIFVLPWTDTPGHNGVFFTVDIEVPGHIYPTEAITRITNVIHRYNRDKQVYSMECSLGEVTSDFGLPEWLERPQVAATPEADIPAVKGDIPKDVMPKAPDFFDPSDPFGAVIRTEPAVTAIPEPAAPPFDILKSVQGMDMFPASAKVTAEQPMPKPISMEPSKGFGGVLGLLGDLWDKLFGRK